MKGRKAKDREISTLLLSGNSLEETAEKADKSTRTIRRYLKKNVERLTFLSELEGTNPSILYSKKLLDIIEHLDNITELILNMEENILTDKQYRKSRNDKSRKDKKILVFRHYCGNDIKCNCCGGEKCRVINIRPYK